MIRISSPWPHIQIVKRSLSSVLCALVLLFVIAFSARTAYAQTYEFKHSSGYAYNYAESGLDSKGRQQVHEWTYDIYVQKGQTLDLSIPYFYSSPETTAYFRWYNFDTDRASDCVSSNNASFSKAQYNIEGESCGLIARNVYTTQDVTTVKYTAPNYTENWKGETIACDISRYVDGGVSGSTFTEPTLSLRYKFYIHRIDEYAELNKQALQQSFQKTGIPVPYENHGNMTLSLGKGQIGKARLWLNMRESSYYSYYDYKNGEFGAEVKYVPTRTDIWQRQYQNIHWYAAVMVNGKIYLKEFGESEKPNIKDTSTEYGYDVTNRARDITVSSFKGTYTELDGSATVNVDNVEMGKPYYIYVYAFANDYDKNSSSPIARFTCYFVNNVPPIEYSKLPSYRQLDYLQSMYGNPVGEINFDDYKGMNTVKPTSIESNQWNVPLSWDEVNYGFVYPKLREFYGKDLNQGSINGYTPTHGEYILIKSANMPNVSVGSWWNNHDYQWFYGTSPTIYDRTYAMSDGAKYGYFFYVDASNESRQLASISFKADLCNNSDLILSMAVADMTSSGSTSPSLLMQLMGVKQDGSSELLQSFNSCDLSTVIPSEDYKLATWYQLYSKIFIPGELDVSSYQSYRLVIRNYSINTNGADYAIDDIRLYVGNNPVQVLQQTGDCDDDAITLKIRQNYNSIESSILASEDEGKPIFWRLCDADGNELDLGVYDETNNPYGYKQEALCKDLIPADYKYGVTYFDKDLSDNQANSKVEYDVNDICYFILVNQKFNLEAGKEFYVSVALPVKKTDGTYEPGTWGKPTLTCTTSSRIFSIERQTAIVVGTNGDIVTSYEAPCGSTVLDADIKAMLKIPDTENGGQQTIDWNFDWFFGSLEEFRSTEGKTMSIENALKLFRQVYPEATTLQSVSGDFTQDAYNLLSAAVAKQDADGNITSGALILCVQDVKGKLVVPSTTDDKLSIVLIPISRNGYTPDGGTTSYNICPEPVEKSFTLSHSGPELKLGFPGVTYPDALSGGAEGVRLGLEQLKRFTSGAAKLRLPIYSMSDKNQQSGTEASPLIITDGGSITLYSTNDPTVSTDRIGKQVGTIVADDSKIEHGTEYLTIDLTEADDITFHEGYEYEMMFSMHDSSDDATSTATCFGKTYFTLKVIPAYVTWTGAVSGNTNWNNDRNWRRAGKDELYKVGKYEDYGTDVASVQQMPGNDESVTPHAYVPMKFTRVVIPTASGTTLNAPYLASYTPNVNTNIIENLNNLDGSAATEHIAYDMMVKIAPETGTTDYACEQFYANTCQDVYFKSEGQMRYQHFLGYAKAWVDFQIPTNEWSMLSSPLKSVYAGDMYVPAATGQQATEAFEDITFSLADGYSRTQWPIYQRSWNKANSIVYTDGTPDSEGRSNYDAAVDYETSSEAEHILSEWSHAYNDVQVPYNPGYGFSIRPEKVATSGEQVDSTLIRIPKADTEYNYYTYNETTGGPTHTVDRTDNYRLATSQGSETDANAVSAFDGCITVTPDATEQGRGYFLVGNPYMASIDMESFFAENDNLEQKYWRMEGGDLVAYPSDATAAKPLGSVPPLQAFFVKVKDGATVSEVSFLPSMTTTIYQPTATTQSTKRLTLRATTAGAASAAYIVLDATATNDYAECEDVERLFDSNLGSRPQLFTIAGQMAASVNRTPDMKNIPLGVSYADDAYIALEVEGLEQLSSPVYLFDSETHTTTPITSGAALSIKANSYGRYFITSEAGVEQGLQTSLRCYSMASGKVTAATSPDDRLTEIAVYDVGGRTHRVISPSESSETFAMPAGVWLVTVNSEAVPEGRTFKVIVK